MGRTAAFQLTADVRAHAWLASNPSSEPRIIAYDVKRCCGGGKICTVQIRAQRDRDDIAGCTAAVLEDGTRFLVDRRAAARLPARFGLTVRGLGPFKHLDLELDSEQWGELLYA